MLHNGDITMTMAPQLVSRKQLRELGIVLSFTQIDRLEKQGRFPSRIKLGWHRESRVVWRYEDVLAWVAERAAATAPLKDDVS